MEIEIINRFTKYFNETLKDALKYTENYKVTYFQNTISIECSLNTCKGIDYYKNSDVFLNMVEKFIYSLTTDFYVAKITYTNNNITITLEINEKLKNNIRKKFPGFKLIGKYNYPTLWNDINIYGFTQKLSLYKNSLILQTGYR